MEANSDFLVVSFCILKKNGEMNALKCKNLPWVYIEGEHHLHFNTTVVHLVFSILTLIFPSFLHNVIISLVVWCILLLMLSYI